MKRLSACLLFLSILLLAACSPASPAPVPTATILPTPVPGLLTVDPAQDLGPISPYIFGTNYGPQLAIPLGMTSLVMSGGFTALRYPAGAWTDSADIQTFELDAFVSFYTQMGALPIVGMRLLGGSPEKAAELVRYANIEKKYGIVYWSIGNEPNIYTVLKQVKYDYTIDNLNQDWRPIALAMKAVDPSIKILGPELSQWNVDYATTPKDSSGRDWMTEFLKVNGDLVDVVTVHRYPLYSPNGAITVQQLRDNTRQWNREVEYLKSLIRQVTGRDIPIAITEVNSDPTSAMLQVASPDSFYNAIWYADVLGRMIQEKVFMLNQWAISGHSGGLGLIHNNDVRPSFYVFPLYKNFGSEQVYASSGVQDVDIFASTRADGTLTLMVINLSDADVRVPLQIKGLTPASAEVWLLDATHNAEDLGQQALPEDGILSLPAQSATLYVIAK